MGDLESPGNRVGLHLTLGTASFFQAQDFQQFRNENTGK
jgi:hypothetical protein